MGPGDRIGTFSILEKLEESSSGAIFRARDEELHRDVTLRLLKEQSGNIKAASAIQHPNVCRIYGASEFDGQSFVILEKLNGDSLNRRLLQGPVTVDEWITLAVGIAEGLQAIHAGGVVHGDLRPSNVFVTEGGVPKILDAGLAPGNIVAYKSPEQLSHQSRIDSRSDLFSLGTMLYEMATGRLPFAGESPDAVADAIVKAQPVPPGSINEELPMEAEHIILRAMEKDRDVRYQTVGDLMADLRRLQRQMPPALEVPRLPWVAIAIGVFVITGIAAGWLWFRPTPAPQSIQSVAILPLQPFAPQDQYLGFGISEGIMTRLASLPQLRLPSVGLSRRFGKPGQDPVEAGKQLKVDSVLDGTLQRDGDRVRVQVQLIRVSDGRILWTSQINEQFSSIFAIEDSISRRVAETLVLQLSDSGKRLLARHTTENPEAYDLFRQGQFQWNKFNETSAARAMELFQKAIDKDPHFAEAYAGLSWANALVVYMDAAPGPKLMPEARRLADRALELDPGLPRGHVAKATVSLIYDWNFPRAEAEARRAIDLDHNFGDAYYVLGACLDAAGKLDEGIAATQKAVNVDPLSPLYMEALATRYIFAKRYPEAQEALRKTLALDPTFHGAVSDLAILAILRNDGPEALRQLTRSAELDHDPARAQAMREAYDKGGLKAMVRKRYEMYGPNPAPLTSASYYAMLGEKELAFAALERALEQRASRLIFLKNSPVYDSMRSDPRFRALLDRIRPL
jgi:TolB-like protein/tetratricopeptide (TPR) repeat protein